MTLASEIITAQKKKIRTLYLETATEEELRSIYLFIVHMV